MSQGTTCFTPACQPAVSLRLVDDQTPSERSSGGFGGGGWISDERCISDFSEDGGCIPEPLV